HHVHRDPRSDDDGLAGEEPSGAEEAGDALGEPTERVGVEVHADDAGLRRAGQVVGAAEPQHYPTPGRWRGSRRRQPVGSRWSITSSMVTTPTRCRAPSHTATATMS